MGTAAHCVRVVDAGNAPRIFATSYTEETTPEGMVEYCLYVDSNGTRVLMGVVTMPPNAGLRAENFCVRQCERRVPPLTG